MRIFPIHRVSLSFFHAFTRLPQAVGLMLLIVSVTACVSPTKPVPTQQAKELPAQTAAPAEATQAAEPPASETPAASQAQPVVPLPAIGEYQTQSTPTEELEARPVLVTAQRESYKVERATTATKTDTPIMETPVSIQVIPQQVLKDQQAFRLEQALRNVSGVYMEPMTTFQGAGEVFSLRGFSIGHGGADSSNVYRNGLRVKSVWSGTGPLETANLERIEVLKGPASILFGRIEPGGLINLVPKQPLATPHYALQQQFGSFNLYRTTADATGPLTKEGNLLYRVNLAYENGGSFVDFLSNERVFFAPTVRWNLSSRTQATVELQYKLSRDPRYAGIPAIGNRLPGLPRHTNLGEPFNRVTSDDTLFSFDWSHAFNASWTLKQRFYANWTNGRERLVQSSFMDVDERTLFRNFFGARFTTQSYATNLDLTGQFTTWGLPHTVLVGMDYYNSRVNYEFSVRSFTPIDIFNPVHGGQIGLDPSGDFLGAQQIKESWYGFYVQDQIRLPYHLHLLAGFRYDNVDYRLPTQTFAAPGDPIPASAETFTAKDQAIKPRVGLLWQPIPELSVYGNYVENFGGRITARGVNNVQLAPQSAQQWEVGIKTELLDKRVTGSLAWFDLTKRNLTTQDPFNPAFSLVTGEVRNRGLELDLAGEVLPGWRLIGVYSYIGSEITSDTIDTAGNPVGNQGNRLFNVPRHGGSVWSMYEFQEGPFRGVKFGGGLVARSAREGDNQNSYQLPGYVIGNLLLGYERRVGGLNVITQLNIENLTDQPYFAGSQGFSAVNAYGMPRAFFGSIRLEY